MESENTVAELEKTRSLADFLQKRKTFFIGLLVVVIGAIAVFFVTAEVLDANNRKKLTVLEDLLERYDQLADRSWDDTADVAVSEGEADADAVDANAEAEIEALLTDLRAFAEDARGYAGAKAWSVVGNIYAEEKKWADAENAFDQSAKKGVKTHLFGPSLFNAGVAAEEGGDIAKAIDYFTQSAGAPTSIIGARALFSVGRLQETQGNKEAARLAYRKVIDDYPDNSGEMWRNLAQTRLIALDEN